MDTRILTFAVALATESAARNAGGHVRGDAAADLQSQVDARRSAKGDAGLTLSRSAGRKFDAHRRDKLDL